MGRSPKSSMISNSTAVSLVSSLWWVPSARGGEQIREEAVGGEGEHLHSPPDRFVADGRGQVALAHAGGPANQPVFLRGKETTGGHVEHQRSR